MTPQPILRVALTSALAASVSLAGCGGGTPPQPERGDGTLVAAKAGDLASFMQAKARERNALRASSPLGLPISATAADGAAAPANTTVAATSLAYSGTTLQEAGVDEDDFIKTDGSTIVTLVPSQQPEIGKPWAKVQLHGRRTDGGVDALGALDLPPDPQAYGIAHGLYYVPSLQRVAVLSESQTLYTFDVCGGIPDCVSIALLPQPPIYQKHSVWLDLVNSATPGSPTFAQRIEIEGRLIGSRRVGNSIVLVTQHTPQLGIEAIPADAPRADREKLIAGISAASVLPKIKSSASAAAQALVAETDCFLQPGNASVGIEITTITVFDLTSDGAQRTSRCFVGGSEALYMTTAALYLATTRYAYDATRPVPMFAPRMTTDIHKFAVSTTLAGASSATIDYRGSAEVAGHLGWEPQKKSYRMSDNNGDLRVLTFTGELGWFAANSATDPNAPPPSPATLHVLRESTTTKQLRSIAKLPNAQRPAALGKPGEQVYAVRFLGNRAYVVTFRRIDPLYILDLSDPADPKSVGELQVAGFSDYLFPMSESLLLGVGKDADANGLLGGVKVALFDVADPVQPVQLNALTFGVAGSVSALDFSRHGINLHPRGNTVRVVLPLALRVGSSLPGPRGLQRLEVNALARTLIPGAMFDAGAGATDADFSHDRAVQIEDHVYYFAGGQLRVAPW